MSLGARESSSVTLKPAKEISTSWDKWEQDLKVRAAQAHDARAIFDESMASEIQEPVEDIEDAGETYRTLSQKIRELHCMLPIELFQPKKRSGLRSSSVVTPLTDQTSNVEQPEISYPFTDQGSCCVARTKTISETLTLTLVLKELVKENERAWVSSQQVWRKPVR